MTFFAFYSADYIAAAFPSPDYIGADCAVFIIFLVYADYPVFSAFSAYAAIKKRKRRLKQIP